MKRRPGALVLVLAAGLVPSSCQLSGEDYVRPEPRSGPADAWNGRLEGAISAADLDPAVLAKWWTTLGDPRLTSLVERATDANLDLRAAGARLRQARAERNLAAVATGPTVGLGGSAATARTSENAGTGDRSTLYKAGLDARWEIDLFGGTERAVEAAEADLQAAEEARRDVLVTVLAEVALDYSDLRTLQRRRGVAAADAAAQEEHLALIAARERAGDASALDVDRAASALATSRGRLPPLDQQIRQAKNRLAVLVGRNPGALDAELDDPRPLPVPSVTVAVGVPAQVLRRRPDVRRAERTLAAETARVGVAISDLHPKFDLSGTIGLESLSVSSLLDQASLAFGLARAVRWDVFDRGRTRQQIEVRSAIQEQALVAYERAILTSLEDVENAIAAYTQELLRRRTLDEALATATRAAGFVQTRYDAGEVDFLAVLDARRERFRAEDGLAASEGQAVASLVRLYKALGGGWDPEAAPDAGNE